MPALAATSDLPKWRRSIVTIAFSNSTSNGVEVPWRQMRQQFARKLAKLLITEHGQNGVALLPAQQFPGCRGDNTRSRRRREPGEESRSLKASLGSVLDMWK